MRISRRQILQLSATILGPGILDFLRTPTWRWSSMPIVQASTVSPSPQGAAPPVQFVDVAREAGLTRPNVWGDVDRKNYIIEAKGSGIAFFDYDQDGWLDIGVVAWIEQRSSLPSSQQIYAAMFRRRTESGRPSSSMRLRIATPTAASAC